MKTTNKVRASEGPKRRLGFNWSLKPFNIYFKILTGITLGQLKPSYGLFFRVFFFIYSSALVISNITVNALWVEELVSIMSPPATNISSDLGEDDNLLSQFIMYVDSNVYYLGIHVTLFATTFTSSWHNLWKTFKQVEDQLQLDDKFYLKCRWLVMIGLLLATIVSSKSKLRLKKRTIF